MLVPYKTLVNSAEAREHTIAAPSARDTQRHIPLDPSLRVGLAEIASAAVAAVLGSQAPQLQRVAGSAHATTMAQPTAWDADCVAIRCALTINVAERTFKGRASVWVRAPESILIKAPLSRCYHNKCRSERY